MHVASNSTQVTWTFLHPTPPHPTPPHPFTQVTWTLLHPTPPHPPPRGTPAPKGIYIYIMCKWGFLQLAVDYHIFWSTTSHYIYIYDIIWYVNDIMIYIYIYAYPHDVPQSTITFRWYTLPGVLPPLQRKGLGVQLRCSAKWLDSGQ